MKNTRRIVSLLLILALLGASCALAEGLPTIDREGNPIALPEDAQKLVSFAPNITQIIIDLGLADRLIAVDTYSALYWPDELDGLVQFDMNLPDAEKLAEMQPDIIFTVPMSTYEGGDAFAALAAMGTCVVIVPTSESIEGAAEDVIFVADCLNMHDEGVALTDAMNAVFDEVAAVGETIEERKTVMFEISALPYIYAPGGGCYLNEMISLIGADNIFADQDAWVPVAEEAALALNPDVILTSTDYLDDPVAEILGRPGWEEVTAVKEQAVYPIDSVSSSLPNHHIAEALVQMALAIYPDEYAALNEQ